MLGKIQFVEKPPPRSESRIGTPLAATALTPGPLKHGKEVDINHLHVSLPRAHASVLKATAKQHGIRLTGELVSCSTRSRAKGHRAPTPHHATRRATQPLGLVHIDTAGPYPNSLGGSRYVVMFVDSASCLQRPYGVREKSAAAILSVVKRFVADIGVPRPFRTDNGTEYSSSMFMDFCNGLGIRRKFTAPYTPHQNVPVESAISRAFKAGHAARLGVQSCTQTSAWKRSGVVVPTRQERASGWSHYSGHRSATTGRQHQWTTSGFPPMRFSTGAARGCHCCPFSSPPITVCRDSGRRIPGPVCVIS